MAAVASLLLVALVGLAPLAAGSDARWAFIGRFAGEGVGMAADSARHARDWQQLAGTAVTVVETVGAGAGDADLKRTRRIARDGEVPCEQSSRVGASETEASFAGFLDWGLALAGDRPCLLALMGHGTGPVWGGAPRGDGWRLWSPCSGHHPGLSAASLAATLRHSLAKAGRNRVQVLVLETCFGASLEVLAELRACAEIIIAAPGEVVSPGIHWRLPRLGEAVRPDALAADLLRGQLSEPGDGPIWSLTACTTTQIGAVTTALMGACSAASREMQTFRAAAGRAEAASALGERLPGCCDLADLAAGLEAYAQGSELGQAADVLASGVRRMVVGRVVLGGRQDARAKTLQRAGVTLGLPPTSTQGIGGYLLQTSLARETGWGKLLEAYLKQSRADSPFIP